MSVASIFSMAAGPVAPGAHVSDAHSIVLAAAGTDLGEEAESWVTKALNWLVGAPLHILAIIAVSIILLAVLHRIIKAATNKIVRGTATGALAKTEIGAALLQVSALDSPRREQRARTVGTVLRSASNLIVAAVAILMILDIIGVNIAPLVASAGIVGVALGFGAQTLVKDFLSGIFLLMEDQYGVGDVVRIGEVTGTVESVALRVTRVRDVDGVLWIIRNGEILKVGNTSQGWSRASVAVRVPHDCDLESLYEALGEAAQQVADDEVLSTVIQGAPTIGGIESMTSNSLTIRAAIRTDPDRVFDVATALRLAVNREIEKRGIALAPDVPPGLLA
ncbi:mechanosensitive ion channel [Rarobacter faecitabidus]|uniref:Small conductance mechanosensitive channel n=1 Tax=Rarobacter faecitabidus TaxID=13243 RepID=A0A542ZWM3_RARFA|nr:mechanosensitive ion channel family protein [Rarobacter faecitabidus]TQL64747.1 small conductance mechanosensitive channel [Rarobacter faecitabidus]